MRPVGVRFRLVGSSGVFASAELRLGGASGAFAASPVLWGRRRRSLLWRFL